MCPNFNKSAVAFTKANKMHRVYKHHHNPPLRSLSTRLSCGLLSPSQLQTESSWLTRGKSAVMRRTLAPCRPMMNLCSQDGASTTRDSMLFAYSTRIWQFNNKVIRLCPRRKWCPWWVSWVYAACWICAAPSRVTFSICLFALPIPGHHSNIYFWLCSTILTARKTFKMTQQAKTITITTPV